MRDTEEKAERKKRDSEKMKILTVSQNSQLTQEATIAMFSFTFLKDRRARIFIIAPLYTPYNTLTMAHPSSYGPS